jgi:hypothetical protein
MVTLLAALATATCVQHIEAPPPDAAQRRAALRQSVRAHGATFWGLRNARTHRFDGRGWNRVYKAALSVRAGKPLRIKVAARDRSWLKLDYDRTRKAYAGQHLVRAVPCAPDTPRFSDDGVVGDETAWAGGFLVERNGCATLLLRREDERRWARVRVPFGRAC